MQKAKVINLWERPRENVGDTFLDHKMYPINPKNIVGQTGLAICFNGFIRHETSIDTWDQYSFSCWFPKSMLVGVFLPGWLFIKKAQAVRDELCNLDRFIELADQGAVNLADFCLSVDEYLINLDADFLD